MYFIDFLSRQRSTDSILRFFLMMKSPAAAFVIAISAWVIADKRGNSHKDMRDHYTAEFPRPICAGRASCVDLGKSDFVFCLLLHVTRWYFVSGVKAAVDSVGPVKNPIVKGTKEKCQKVFLDVRLCGCI